MEALLRLRISNVEANYGGNLVDGARILKLYGDAATELLIKNDGDEGLFVSYDNIEFLGPVYGGDFVEVRAKLENQGNSSRKMAFEAYVVIRQKIDISPSSAEFLEEPILINRASGTCVVKKELQRFNNKEKA